MAKIYHPLPTPIPTPEGDITHGLGRDVNATIGGGIVVSVASARQDESGDYHTDFRRYDRISFQIEAGGDEDTPGTMAHYEAWCEAQRGKPAAVKHRQDLSDLFAYADELELWGNA